MPTERTRLRGPSEPLSSQTRHGRGSGGTGHRRVLDDLEVLEDMVDSPEERERVREAIRTALRAGTPRVFGPFDVVTGRFMSVTGTGDV